ncbi:MAG: MFS transporter [Chloroflexi bacterium]|nr:MFS transporter [Chloroflexota bacterium]
MTGAGRPAMLAEADRRRGLIVMLVDTFLMWGGFFMVIPLISIHYVDGLGWAAGAIGLVLAVRQLTQQGLTVIGGALADRLGARGLIAAGMLIRALSFGGMAVATTYPLLMLSALLAALGGALFDSPSSATIAALTRREDRSRYFALLGVVRGLGMSLGPLAGAALLRLDFALVALAASACFLLAFGVTLLFLPPVRVATERGDLMSGTVLALRDRRFMMFNILLMGYWFMWVQLTISLPLEARALAGTADAVSWLYTLNAVMSIVLQYPVMQLAERWLRPMPILMLGMAVMALGLGGVALAGNIVALLACVALFSLGALLAAPGQQTVAADLANPAALGSYFGVSALALALGGGIGNYAGGVLYGFARDAGVPALPWFICLVVGISSVSGLALLDRRLTRRMAHAVDTAASS